ncbi:GNAT family N-acetyltransferase [Pseudopedobacter beijingensis]|uniref:GNAT family N-acetyltransferase n=1 Tax=Pseudopedobacter beijingensis TaxID=1207056 RepID=A0ABW4IFD4_9SPHI
MNIRKIKPEDAPVIVDLLEQLGYPNTSSFIDDKIKLLLSNQNEYCMVAEDQFNYVIAFISIHIIPQIALQGDFARISYFAVDEKQRGKGLGKILEEYCTQIARERNCDRIELHSHSRREKAHKFYFRQGYTDSPKYLVKKL